jgi:hypothetical protein
MFAYVRLIREKSLRALRAAIAGWWKPGRVQISHRESFDKSHDHNGLQALRAASVDRGRSRLRQHAFGSPTNNYSRFGL